MLEVEHGSSSGAAKPPADALDEDKPGAVTAAEMEVHTIVPQDGQPTSVPSSPVLSHMAMPCTWLMSHRRLPGMMGQMPSVMHMSRSQMEQSTSSMAQSPVQEKSDAIPLEAPSTQLEELSEELVEQGEKVKSAPSPLPSLVKVYATHLACDRDPESDSGLPDHSSEPHQHPQAEMAVGAMESTGTVSSSPPPPLVKRRDSPSSPRSSRIPVRDPTAPVDSPTRDLERRHRWSSPIPGSPTHSPSPSLSCDNLPCALPRDRFSFSERGSRSDLLIEDPLSLSSSSGSKSKIPRPVYPTVVPEQLTGRFLPRPPPGKPPTRPVVDIRRRRFRVRASSTSDADFLASLTQLMQDRGGALFSPPPRPRSSSSSLQRSLSSSPSRHELREVFLGRSRSPSSFSGSPPSRHAHPQDRPSGQAQWGLGPGSQGRGLNYEAKGTGKVSR